MIAETKAELVRWGVDVGLLQTRLIMGHVFCALPGLIDLL